MESTFIFPNQLFYPHPAISKKRTIFLIQDPVFFYERETKLKFHKQKILLHMLSMNEYENELINKGYRVLNITFEHFHNNNNYESIIKNNEITNLHLCDVVDTFLLNNINNDCKKLGVKIQWYDSPSFLLNQTDIYNEFGNKKFHFMSNFYKKQRRRFNILMDKKNPIGGKWSYDTENRKKLPRGINIPNITTTKYDK
ncbi:MAG: cryptochrome/photolyase family protein, partial [Candidatus Marinimicrobia bacterium]|nr:cryptochrome/photolyase family protein [Candidatus Neomarinimicrobiota bacterium]